MRESVSPFCFCISSDHLHLQVHKNASGRTGGESTERNVGMLSF